MKFWVPCTALVLCFLCGTTNADFVLSFESNGQFSPNELSVTAGSQFSLNVLLTQTPDESALDSSASGLVSANFVFDTSNSFIQGISYSLGSGFVERPDALGNPNNSLITDSLLRIDAAEA